MRQKPLAALVTVGILAITLVAAVVVLPHSGFAASTTTANATTATTATATVSPANLELAGPTLAMAPDDTTTSSSAASTSPACTTPAPAFTYALFHCYRPAQLTAAYGVDRLYAEGITGKGQTIVVVDPYGSPTAQHDLDSFSDTFGLPHTTLTVVYPTGTPPANNAVDGSQTGWALETSLDLQWAHAIAPDAHLVLVASNPSETQGVQGFPSILIGEQYAVSHYPGAVITQSFGSNELSFHAAAPEEVARFDDVFQQAVTNHVTLLAASGDTGTTNFDKQGRAFSVPSVNWPASDPLVTAVGGTWLQDGFRWNPNTPTDPSDISSTSSLEAAWNEPPLADATGGGLSTLFTTPAFQASVSQALLQGHRGVPDLAWNAAVDGGCLIYTSFGGVRVGWHILGGTSAATPQVAGLVALANQLAHDQGKGAVGYLNPYLYQLPARDFHDMVALTFGPGAIPLNSNQQYTSSIPGMAVTTGYDLATGFGSPNADTFVHDLVAALP